MIDGIDGPVRFPLTDREVFEKFAFVASENPWLAAKLRAVVAEHARRRPPISPVPPSEVES